MIDKFYIELINKEIDGVITESEKNLLHDHLAVNPAALDIYSQLRQTSELLSKIPQLRPSPQIKRSIMGSIDSTRYSASQKSFAFRSLASSLFRTPSPKLAYAFSLGILIGILLHSVIFENIGSKRTDPTEISGTIGIDGHATSELIKQVPITHPNIDGTIKIKKFKNLIIVEADIRTQRSSQMVIEFDKSYLQFIHFIKLNGTKTAFESGDDHVRIQYPCEGQFELFFSEITTHCKPLVLTFFASGELYHRNHF